MTEFTNDTRVILIGGSSHVGKSTLAKSLAEKLGWSYRSTDRLARHPGRPWVAANGKAVKEHVVEHYKMLSVDNLFSNVLAHYEQSVLPQVEAIVRTHSSDLSTECLVLEGSALYPRLLKNLVREVVVQGIWLTASDKLFQNRIFSNSNFYNVDKEQKYLIQKFLARTLLYNQHTREEVEQLGFIHIDIESVPTTDELLNKCIELTNIHTTS